MEKRHTTHWDVAFLRRIVFGPVTPNTVANHARIGISAVVVCVETIFELGIIVSGCGPTFAKGPTRCLCHLALVLTSTRSESALHRTRGSVDS